MVLVLELVLGWEMELDSARRYFGRGITLIWFRGLQ